MRLRGSFERRLAWVVILFSLVPALLVLVLGTYLLSQAVAITGPAAAWERAVESGRPLLELAAASDDPAAEQVAERHAEELSGSLLQARRWQFLVGRTLTALPFLALALALIIGGMAVLASRTMARGLSRPVIELMEWARRLGRGEPLPPRGADEDAGVREFALLRRAFRDTARELEASRRTALEAERMRAWVTIARGVAHEIKNPLTPMRLALSALQRGPGAGDEPLEILEQEIERLDALARSFAQLGRAPEGSAAEVDLEELLRSLLSTHLPPGVAASVEVEGSSPRVHGHLDALSRAFANLILNASDAMQGSGELRVALSAAAGEVEIRLADSGPGVPADQLERVFDPDFTTKPRGTGLGLALVRQTVRHHGGEVRAASAAGGGAEFVVNLPRAGAASGAARTAWIPPHRMS